MKKTITKSVKRKRGGQPGNANGKKPNPLTETISPAFTVAEKAALEAAAAKKDGLTVTGYVRNAALDTLKR